MAKLKSFMRRGILHWLLSYPATRTKAPLSIDVSIASRQEIFYLQSELAELEALLDKYDNEDRSLSTDEKMGLRNWEVLQNRATEQGNTRAQERMELILKIREKIKEYREALVLESTLISFQAPIPRTLEAFQKVFRNQDDPSGPFPTLGGQAADILNDSNDLIALKSALDEDRLTKYLRRYLPFLFITQMTNSNLAYLSETRLRFFVAAVNLVLAVTLLFGAIINLYYVTDSEKRLGLIAAYTITFAAYVGLLTNARRVEVFAACAAYAAVLVVFVSGNLGSNK